MDIRGWPLDQIMQLPDCYFGRKFPIILSKSLTAGTTAWYISEIGLPDRCVLWELQINVRPIGYDYSKDTGYISLALGDHLPLTLAEFLEFENMFPESDERIAGLPVLESPLHIMLRKPYAAQGRRVVAQFLLGGLSPDSEYLAALVFSSVPMEIPDCLVSEYLRSR